MRHSKQLSSPNNMNNNNHNNNRSLEQYSQSTTGLLQSTLTLSKSATSNNQIYKQGYLSKKPLKSSKSTFKYKFKGWKKRWFVLQKTSIYYYKDAAIAAAAQLESQNSKYQPLGIISLAEDIKIEKDEIESVESGMFVFKIITPYAQHLIAASSEQERREWIDSIVGITGAIQVSKLVQYVTKLQVTIVEAKLNDEFINKENSKLDQDEKNDIIQQSHFQVNCKVKSNFQEFSTVSQTKTLNPIWNETFILEMPRFPMEIFFILDLTENVEKKVTNLLSNQDYKKMTHLTQYSRNGLVKMTILEPDLTESLNQSTDAVNLSYFQLVNSQPKESQFEVSFEKWFNAILEEDQEVNQLSKSRSKFLIENDDQDDDQQDDSSYHNNSSYKKSNQELMKDLYEPSMKRKKRQLGKIYARVEYIFEDMQGFPLSYQSIQNQIKQALKLREELMNKILNTKKENTSQKKLLGMFQDSFMEDEENNQSSSDKRKSKNNNTTILGNDTKNEKSVEELLNEQKRKHRRNLIYRRYKQELDRVMSDRNSELLKRTRELQKTQLEILQESIQQTKQLYENIENEYQKKEIEQERKLQLKIKREEESRIKEMNKSLKQKEYEKKKQLSIQTNREKLLDERNRIREVLKFKKEKSKHFEKLHSAIKEEEERVTSELQENIEKKEREFKLRAQRRVQENEEKLLRELDDKIKREEEFKARKLRSEISQLEKEMATKMKQLEEREMQTKQLEEHQRLEYKKKVKELQKKVKEEELNMLVRMQERLQSNTSQDVSDELNNFMKKTQENYQSELKLLNNTFMSNNNGNNTNNGNNNTNNGNGNNNGKKQDSLADFSSLATISNPTLNQLKLEATFTILEYEMIEFKLIGIDIWKSRGFLHEYEIINYSKLLPKPSRKDKNEKIFTNSSTTTISTNTRSNGLMMGMGMDGIVPPPPTNFVPPPPLITTPIVNTGGIFKVNITRKEGEKSSLEKHNESNNSGGMINLNDILAQKGKLKSSSNNNTNSTNNTKVATPIGMSNNLFTSLQNRRRQLSDSEDESDDDTNSKQSVNKTANPMMNMLLQRIERLKREQKQMLDEEEWETEFGNGPKNTTTNTMDDEDSDSDEDLEDW